MTIPLTDPSISRWILLHLIVSLGWAHVSHAATPRLFEFPSTGVTFDARFEGARLSDCRLDDSGEYRVLIRPENQPVNDSAWYAFRVWSEQPKCIDIRLTYEGGQHRYYPKLSRNGSDWKRLSETCYSTNDTQATLRVAVGPEPLWIAGQERVGARELNGWIDKMGNLSSVRIAEIGRSVGDRPIRKLTIAEGQPGYAVFIIGRQHPPEATGSFALTNFVETIAGSSSLAKGFREHFETTVIPLVNPDGVAAGHWRHNLNGVDLNRDWGPFLQPETQRVRDEILRYRSDTTPRLAFFLDFHSTQQDIFYLESDDEGIRPTHFSEHWLDALAERMPDYNLEQDLDTESHPYSKDWVHETMKIPAVIYEVGDETDRDLIRRVAVTAAEEMMRLLLEEVADPTQSLKP